MTEGLIINPSEMDRLARLNWITEKILQNGSVTVEELCEQLEVSRMTIHRDLDELEEQGVLRKVRGGATAQRSSLYESSSRYRMRVANLEKEAIARKAVTLIEPGQAILLDDSTTTVILSRHIVNIAPLTIITNCLQILYEMSGKEGIRLISLGGEYVPHYDVFAGLLCERSVESIRANILFMSTSAINESLAFHQDQNVVKTKRSMMASATRKILMVDHTKVRQVALHKLASLKEFNLVITDEKVETSFVRDLQNAGVQVEIAPIESP
jgi:DeoR/GlpR family transcriptional regulator of sugar metabolism